MKILIKPNPKNSKQITDEINAYHYELEKHITKEQKSSFDDFFDIKEESKNIVKEHIVPRYITKEMWLKGYKVDEAKKHYWEKYGLNMILSNLILVDSEERNLIMTSGNLLSGYNKKMNYFYQNFRRYTILPKLVEMLYNIEPFYQANLLDLSGYYLAEINIRY